MKERQSTTTENSQNEVDAVGISASLSETVDDCGKRERSTKERRQPRQLKPEAGYKLGRETLEHDSEKAMPCKVGVCGAFTASDVLTTSVKKINS